MKRDRAESRQRDDRMTAGEPCEAALAVGSAYLNYEKVRQALASGVSPTNIPNANCFINGDLSNLDADEATVAS